MKCSYCGKELEKGSEFCPECGMILGLNESEDKKGDNAEPEFKVPEYTPNVFKAIDVEEAEEVPAAELEADSKEEVVSVTENIPEFVSEVPEYTPAEVNEETAGMEFEDISSVVPEENAVAEEPVLAAPEYVPAPDMPKEDDLQIRVPEGQVTYPEYEKYKNEQSESEVVTPTEEAYEEIDSDDIYVKSGKKKNTLAVFLVIAVICVIVGGVYAVKNVIPVSTGGDETSAEVQQSTDVSEEETDEETTEAETTADETTGDETTQEETTEDTAADVTEDEETTEEISSTESGLEFSTTKADSTRPSVTYHYSSGEPATTKRPSTTNSSSSGKTTDPYGINDVKVKRPSKVYDKTYVLFCTAEGVRLRSEPSTSSERVLFLSKGADLTVYAKENGFYYVRSNRYGVYGWVSAEYTSKERPEEETTKTYKNTVSPDKKYDKVETKHTTNGLNIRKGPGKDYEIVSLIPKGYPVKVIGYKKNVSGWVYVTDTTYGISGWVSDAYLK